MDKNLLLSDIAAALDIPLMRVRTMRRRGHSAMWDNGIDDGVDDLGRGWRRYSLIDAVAFSCVLELVDRGLMAEVASSIVANCRQHIYYGPHPASPSADDVLVGAIYLSEGRAHVGGPLPALLADVEKCVQTDVRDFSGGGSAIFLVNASNHHRRLKEKLSVK